MQQIAQFFLFFHGSMPPISIPLTDSQLPTLNVYYRTSLASKLQGSMPPSSPNREGMLPYPSPNNFVFCLVVVAMNTDIFKLFLP